MGRNQPWQLSRKQPTLEKYNVEQMDVLAGGGEYGVQAGFSWTNGVLIYLMNRLETP
jgi:alpha,alpha-trehalase